MDGPIPIAINRTPANFNDHEGFETSSDDWPAISTTKTRRRPLLSSVNRAERLWVRAAPVLHGPPINDEPAMSESISAIDACWLNPNTTLKVTIEKDFQLFQCVKKQNSLALTLQRINLGCEHM